jgi:hypothetical protein
MKLIAMASFVLVGLTLLAGSAFANSQVMTVYHVDQTYSERSTCGFRISWRVHGSFKDVGYYNSSGFLYKSIDTPGGGGPFTVTATAHGTTLTQQSEAYSVVITYNSDGSARTYTQRGPFDRFTTPGDGVVLLDTGIAMWGEPGDILVFTGGPHQAVNGDFDAFCAALS